MMSLKLVCCAVLVYGVMAHAHEGDTEKNDESLRGRRDVIEEEKYYNIRTDKQPWLPGHAEDPTTRVSITSPHYQTTEVATDKPTGRGARASNENWIKLPFPDRDEGRRDELANDLQDLQPPQELISSRMPRVNFVTQNKALEASESRAEKEPARRSDDLRTEFVRDKPVYPRQAVYYPETRYDDRYYADEYRRDPYYDVYDRRAAPRDRYDDYDAPRKPKRIIYYAHLPDVVRAPPTDRYRYSIDPYRREDDYYARTGRYDYRFRPRYPYAPLRKEERRFGYRDQAPAGTVAKDKKADKVTPTPVLPKKEEKVREDSRDVSNTINSHQYHETSDNFFLTQPKGFSSGVRDDSYFRFDGPLFHGTVEDPYQRKY